MDETFWLAVAGILGTLLAGPLSQIVAERMRRKSERQRRLHDERVSAYADLLTA